MMVDATRSPMVSVPDPLRPAAAAAAAAHRQSGLYSPWPETTKDAEIKRLKAQIGQLEEDRNTLQIENDRLKHRNSELRKTLKFGISQSLNFNVGFQCVFLEGLCAQKHCVFVKLQLNIFAHVTLQGALQGTL